MNDSGFAGALDFLQQLDEGHDERFGELSRALTNNLFVLLRSAGMHDLDNEALHRPLENMHGTVQELFERYGDAVHLSLIDGNFFVNRRIIRLDFSSFQNIRYLRRIFEYLGINEMSFLGVPSPVELRNFLNAFLQVVRTGAANILSYDLHPIRMRVREEESFDELRRGEDPRNQVLSVYASGLLMLRQFVNDLRKGRSPRHAKVKRLCLELIDVEPRHHNLLLALAHLEAYKGNLFSHMLNTAVLAIVFGRRIGLDRDPLVDLGMAAFHHDLGWALLGALEEEAGERDLALTMAGINYVRNHSATEMDELRVKVARALVRLGGFNELVINRLIVAYECQIPEDAPAENLYYGEIGASFMTHVVRMASTYDELTTPRQGGEASLRPDQAMKRILDDGGRTFDVFLAKLFANCIGAYPIGTLVELDTGEKGLVVNLPSNPVNFHRPQVKLVVDRNGRRVDDGAVVDLDEQTRSGRYVRTIEHTYDVRAHGLSVTSFFFG
ncbi:MAG: hypothetical protein KC620_11145 [Myxococcales bacterium]|nr:hypothetical protein [Myxococcales bacterium]